MASAGYLDSEIAETLRRTRAEVQAYRWRHGIRAGMSPGIQGAMMRLAQRRA